ncbi:fasciclin domain-containing protein [Albibacterium profundi]|uniref:Fasciclin domain-containing protein n=1 Tax=Albibacterium profundi TaxID=3134906 RepID=A0ABV5CH97_9SPHI
MKYRILFLGLIIALAGCEKQFSDARYNSDDELQIIDYIESREDLSTFLELVEYTNQRSLLKTAGAYTLFAPTNSAFENLFKTLAIDGKRISSIKDAEPTFWLEYFRYHLLDAKINTNVFTHGPLPEPTLFQDKFLIADISNSYTAISLNNNAVIKEYNINLNNGFVNIIDQVLVPPTQSIHDLLSQSGRYTTMLSVFEETDLVHYLKDSLITLLIESDEALEESNFKRNEIENLKEWASYHIIPDSGYYLNLLTAQRFYPLYDKESLGFSVDEFGQYSVNSTVKFDQTSGYGIDRVASNGIFHTLAEKLEITESVPAVIRLNLYPPGSNHGKQNVFASPPARILLNTGTRSYHQNKEFKIVQFNATQVGDYFWTTVPDVPSGKYRIRVMHRVGGTRGKFLTIYNDEIVGENINMAVRDGIFEEYDYYGFNYAGDIEVEERGDVQLYFAFTDFGSNKNPSYCCDLLLDMIELIPINE